MNNLIETTENKKGEILVNGRVLHDFLQVETPYHIWFPRMTSYGFVENVDFISFEQKSSKLGGRPKIDQALNLDMAKEISMIQRSEKGRQARQYFLDIERKFKTQISTQYQIPTKLSEALRLAADLEEQNEQLQLANAELKPKALFADAVATSHTSILVGELAKIIKQNGVDIGAKRLFNWLRDKGYLVKRKGTEWNMPTQKSMELKLFEVKETAVSRSDGSVSISKTAKVTGKGQQYFINKFLNHELQNI